jgi:hypothetical protein
VISEVVGARKRGRDRFVCLRHGTLPSKFWSKSVQEAVAQLWPVRSVQSCGSSAYGKVKITHAIPTTAHYCSRTYSLLALAALNLFAPLPTPWPRSLIGPHSDPSDFRLRRFSFFSLARVHIRVIILHIHFIAGTPSLHRVHPPKPEAVHLSVNLNAMRELISSQSSLESLSVAHHRRACCANYTYEQRVSAMKKKR